MRSSAGEIDAVATALSGSTAPTIAGAGQPAARGSRFTRGGNAQRGAAEAGGLSWTDIYPFFTDRAAGITASLPLSGGADGARAVIGADVALQDISAFISAFVGQDPAADLAEPFGILDLADISAFVASFVAGCP